MPNPTLLEQNAMGRWTETTAISLEQLVGGVYPKRGGFGTVTDTADALDRLARGFEIRYAREWYQCVKRVNTPEEIARLRALMAAPIRTTEQVCHVTEE